jgi:hypothetical protein
MILCEDIVHYLKIKKLKFYQFTTFLILALSPSSGKNLCALWGSLDEANLHNWAYMLYTHIREINGMVVPGVTISHTM